MQSKWVLNLKNLIEKAIILYEKSGKLRVQKQQPRRASKRATNYREYLKSDTWRALRRRIFNKYGNRCAVCNSPFELHLHHRTYERVCREADMDVIPLCAECHEMFHKNRELYRDYRYTDC